MKIVIQCAKKKKNDTGYMRTEDGQPVIFVADPSLAPPGSNQVYARPDDIAPDGRSWREILSDYNRSHRDNPLGLYRAIELYRNTAYAELDRAFDRGDTYILSAGWGLVPGDFLLPYYDITLSNASRDTPHTFRRTNDHFHDFSMLPDGSGEVSFVGGKSYIPLFCKLTESYSGNRIVWFNSGTPPTAPGCILKEFRTKTRTNWHYECARHLCREASGARQPDPLAVPGDLQAQKVGISGMQARARRVSAGGENSAGHRRGKYQPLFDHLNSLPDSQEQTTLSCSMIEDILGSGLPRSAVKYQAFWLNGGHSHAGCWTDAGFRVDGTNLAGQIEGSWIRFCRSAH